MFKHLPLVLTGCLLIVLLVSGSTLASKQSRPTVTSFERAAKTAHAELLQAARAARTNEPEAVRGLVRQVLRASEFLSSVPSSVEDRLVRAELSLRNGSSRGVSSESIVSAINDAVERWKLPPYFRMSLGQLQMFRSTRAFLLRDFVKVGFSTGQESERLSPAEALFVVTDLAKQKHFIEENQVEPEVWEARTRQRLEEHQAAERERRERGESPDARTQFGVSVARVSPPPLLGVDLSTEDSVAVSELNRLLDAMGVHK